MKLKPGYKQTEVGIIPEDWEVKALGDVFDFSGGYSASRDQLGATGTCYLHYGDIHTSSNTFIDVESSYLDIPKIGIEVNSVSRKSLLKDGDVVFVDASEDEEGVSKYQVVFNASSIDFISGLHTIVAKEKSTHFTKKYKQHCFQAKAIKEQFRFYAVGTKVSGVSKSKIVKIFIALPPKDEQEAIAEALSDADALIESLEQLITKKRALKLGAMQELLTGARRLPGFSGDWETKRLCDIAEMSSGGTPLSSNPTYYDGDIPWVSISDMTKCGKIITQTERNLSITGLNNSAAQMFPRGNVLYAMYASLGECSIAGVSVSTSQAILGIQPKKTLSCEFLYYFLTSIKDVVKNLGQQGTQSNLNKGMVQSFEIKLPPTREEQTAIAQVLSEMDAELASLEARRNKARELKQGMMQQLLTGTIRLVKPTNVA